MTQRFRLATLYALMFLSFAAEAQPKLQFVQEGKQLFLSDGKARLLWMERTKGADGKENWSSDSEHGEGELKYGQIQLQNDRVLTLSVPWYVRQELNPDVVLSKASREIQRVSLTALKSKWLNDDALWGGHEAANETRYVNNRGGYHLFFDAVQAYGKGFLAILNWQDAGGSGSPVHHQHLVKSDVEPKLEIAIVSQPPALPMESQYETLPPRLFRFGNDFLLYSVSDKEDHKRKSGTLTHLSPAGKLGRVFVNLPPYGEPQGVIGSRWLVGSSNIYAEKPIAWILDLQTKQIRSLSHLGKFGNVSVTVPNHANRFLFVGSTSTQQETKETVFCITLPAGKAQTLPPNNGQKEIWGEYVLMTSSVEQSLEEIRAGTPSRGILTVYSAATGKTLQRLEVPQ